MHPLRVARAYLRLTSVIVTRCTAAMHGRFLTISERLSGMNKAAPPADSRQTLSYRNLGTHGSSSNVYVASESMDSKSGTGSSGLVGTDYILNVSLRCVLIHAVHTRLHYSCGKVVTYFEVCFYLTGLSDTIYQVYRNGRVLAASALLACRTVVTATAALRQSAVHTAYVVSKRDACCINHRSALERHGYHDGMYSYNSKKTFTRCLFRSFFFPRAIVLFQISKFAKWAKTQAKKKTKKAPSERLHQSVLTNTW